MSRQIKDVTDESAAQQYPSPQSLGSSHAPSGGVDVVVDVVGMDVVVEVFDKHVQPFSSHIRSLKQPNPSTGEGR